MTCFPNRRILVIEDDPLLGVHLNEHLERRGFVVTLCSDGHGGLELASECDFDLILLDILLPGLNGLEVLARLRQRRHVPVILISALGDEQDRITGFSRGADDYLPKPFGMGELQVRIEAILRRVAYERGQPVHWGGSALHLDEMRCDVRHGDGWAGLTLTEYRLLETFARHPGEVLSKPFLYQQVLRRGYSQYDRSLDMHISNIRRKLAGLGVQGVRLETVWGKGYLLELQVA
ncbi:Two-component response regulator [Azotobacter vinelandii CA]|uniref:Two-component response regulator n=2 Tax=Azotobacter vinelandii TaxID=354 RepID=C1DRX6_AZOVD|nr:response regulator transcription factor [Azotobacter vinelandii]ACO79851.1 Two-component response regulator [Azotobacter vinelandii DJ]AGK16193.1 Two-component response regulator [Azotobacter vinelandii CA]AGK21552.1 Two-component response regulator [Azotobacter vinelandii CA6]WKN20654.1 response regulator transcription factor [Azotobacter vinelandii]SFX43748.1 DNA-binding response regulator, OmpR family, contains REC and winged-helix (wHTH) domain [Azotobacter vinelandii]